MRLAIAVAITLAAAPLQCGARAEGDVRREESAGDALWGLAAAFRARGEEAAARATLRYLAERYPSSRFAPAAREQLGER